MKKIIKILSIFLIFNLFLSINVKANHDDVVYLGGDSIGIKMDTGVYVAGKYAVNTGKNKVIPWKNSNIEIGDRVISVNNILINNNKDLLDVITKTNNDVVNLTVLRNNNRINTEIKIVKNQKNESSIGLYIKDQLQGIGTLTFTTKDSYFASLGHGVYENKTLINNQGGNIYFSSVNTIKKAEPGIAGEKRASITPVKIGEIVTNDISGLYGKVTTKLNNSKEIKLIKDEEIKIGHALIYTVIDSNYVKSYDVEIIEINNQKSKATKGVKIKITDEELINKTGGIVQGMSGSPIVQDGKLVGAVSHVTVDNPTFGYGMYAKWMLDEINIIS